MAAGSVSPTSTKPDFYSVEELAERVRTGEMRVPRFQRPYVWSPDDMVRLFDSVLQGYPIGSLLIWQTDRGDITSLDTIGPVTIPDAGEGLKSYVVDGHQRLATLVGVLALPDDFPRQKADEWKWWVAYDLREEQFLHLRPSIGEPPLHVIPLRELLRTVNFARRAGQILRSDLYSSSEAERLVDRADEVQRAIRSYRVPYTLMRSGSLDDAVTIFSRVNQRGRDMTADQMVSALTFRDRDEGDFDLASVIDDILGELRALNFGDVERRIVLQTILAMANIDFTRTSYEALVDRKSHHRLVPAVSQARVALLKGVEFLRSDVGVRTVRLLPYASILVMLAIYFGELERLGRITSAGQKAFLRKWFWAVSFNGWFAGANTTDLRQAANAVRYLAAAETDSTEGMEALFISKGLRPFPEAFDRRSARIRASLLVQIISGKPLDPRTGEQIDGAEIFDQASTRDVPYFFPGVRKPLVSSPANRVILPGSYPRNVRPFFLNTSGSDQGAAVLNSHFIDAEALAHLTSDNAEGFLAVRERRLLAAEEEYLRQFELFFDPTATRNREEFDADE